MLVPAPPTESLPAPEHAARQLERSDRHAGWSSQHNGWDQWSRNSVPMAALADLATTVFRGTLPAHGDATNFDPDPGLPLSAA